MTDNVLTVLKFAFLALLYLFFLRTSSSTSDICLLRVPDVRDRRVFVIFIFVIVAKKRRRGLAPGV